VILYLDTSALVKLYVSESIHLAAADRIYRKIDRFVFLSFDQTLNRAARLLGMTLPDFV